MSAPGKSSKIPTPPPSTTLSISSSCTIRAPAPDVFHMTTNPHAYADWNSFATSGEITSHPAGDSSVTPLTPQSTLTIHVRMKPSDAGRTATKLRVTELSMPTDPEAPQVGDVYRIVWSAEGFGSSWALRTSRTQEVEVCEDGMCEFRTWEWMSGPLAKMVKSMYGVVLQERFEDWARDLKQAAESATT